MSALEKKDVQQWRNQGYAVVDNLVDVSAEYKEMAEFYPADKEDVLMDFGQDKRLGFPSQAEAINNMAVNPTLLEAASQLLGTNDIVLMQSVAWAKYGRHEAKGPQGDSGSSNSDQRLHMDYGNNMWVHPPPFDSPNVVAMIVYITDASKGGGTAVVPRQGDDDPIYQRPYKHMPGQNGLPFINNRDQAEAMMKIEDPTGYKLRQDAYAREIISKPKAGSVLLYRHDVWHRGTPVPPNTVRYVHNLAWCVRHSPGLTTWNEGFCQWMYYGWVEKFVAGLSGRQLLSIGFPKPDNAYWTADAKECVQMRYGVDIYTKLLEAQ